MKSDETPKDPVIARRHRGRQRRHRRRRHYGHAFRARLRPENFLGKNFLKKGDGVWRC